MSDQSAKRVERFAQIFDTHGPKLMAMLRRLARDRHNAEEAFQETALRVWKHLAKMPRIRRPQAWLMTIGYRTFLDTSARHRQGVALKDYCDPHERSPADVVTQREAAEHVNGLVADLPDDLRDVVILHYSGGLSIRQTAKATGVPLGTAKSRLNQALTRLRKQIE